MKNSPSAFIPFCEYNGDMLSVGEHIDNFSFPVCNAFRPTLIEGQLCYQFDRNNLGGNLTSSKEPYLMFLMDTNDDRQYNVLLGGDNVTMKEPQGLNKMKESNAIDNEAMIYIDALGKK